MLPYSLEQLEAFSCTAEQGSFSAAARTLGKSQAAISQAVINLEVDLGVTLFERKGRVPTLTSEGQELLIEAQTILGHCRHFLDKGYSYASGVEQQLRLAIESILPSQRLTPLLKDFAQQFPYVRLDIQLCSIGEAISLISQRQGDLALVSQYELYPRQIKFQIGGNLTLLLVAAPDHPLNQLKYINEEHLSHHLQLHIRHCSGRTPLRISSQIWDIDSPALLTELLCQGVGWALVPQDLVRWELEQKRLIELPARFHQGPMLMPVDLIWSPACSPGPALKWLQQNLLSAYSTTLLS